MSHKYATLLSCYEVAIVIFLFAKPMTSIELRKVTGLPSFRLKTILNRLKEKGIIGYELDANPNNNSNDTWQQKAG